MNEQREKKEWISPEIIDLDVMETAGTKLTYLSSEYDTYTGPS
ncbi:hypothetical protein [Paludibacter jiangxiensis]|uniref:Uncharacterized protein n=1 Tax=Paludibacter jiangxiensis TaxID=681398 RepID=A0A171A1J5_9BACT|nr:hypothetical protein [Paludibacter jiangxiensis]GAT63213.1 hypothetical protein PJIAN_3528 [Paludibacter jiangxiensis]